MAQHPNNLLELSPPVTFETQVQKLFDRLKQNRATRSVEDSPLLVQEDDTGADYTLSNILTDSGSGRISQGLDGLELMTKLCDGADASKLFLFDRIIFAGTPSQFRNATDTQLYQLVQENLGMTVVTSVLAETTTAAFKTRCIVIGKEVRTGAFSPPTHKAFVIAECKRLTKLYMKKVNSL